MRWPLRRRGIAGAVTSRLIAEAFAAGVSIAFPTPAGAAAERIYAACGFRTVSEVLHIPRPG